MAAHAVQPTLRTEKRVMRSPRPVQTARRRSRKAVRRARTLAVLFVLLVAALVLFLFPRTVHTESHNEVNAGIEYTVLPGDTLWEIGSRHAGRNDVREIIWRIQQANGLESAVIQPGQVLFIPAVPGSTIVGR